MGKNKFKITNIDYTCNFPLEQVFGGEMEIEDVPIDREIILEFEGSFKLKIIPKEWIWIINEKEELLQKEI